MGYFSEMNELTGRHLELLLSGNKLYPKDSSTGNFDEIELPANLGAYKISIDFDFDNSEKNAIDKVSLVINDEKGEIIETSLMTQEASTDFLYHYEGTLNAIGDCPANTTIYLGLVYIDKNNVSYRSIPIRITLIPTINDKYKTVLNPESLYINQYKSAAQILQEVNKFKGVGDIEYSSNESNTSKLEISYIDTTKKRINLFLPTTASLGLIIPRDNKGEEGGGGRVGIGANLLGETRSGFSGGYKASTHTGAAVGQFATSGTGFAGGSNAKAYRDGICIGKNAKQRIDTDKEYGVGVIAIGNTAQVVDCHRAISLGYYATTHRSNGAIAIGGGPYGAIEDTYEETIKYKSNWSDAKSQAVIKASKRTRVKDSSCSIALGWRSYCDRTAYSIAIGNLATVRGYEGKNSNGVQNGKIARESIAIGNYTFARYNSCISIGTYAKAGTKHDGSELLGNYKEEGVKSGKGHTGAIAIGRAAWARRHATIAIGKSTKALQMNCISIGPHSIAGNTGNMADDETPGVEAENKKRGGGTGGAGAIAIGYKAVASAKNSVQIGTGTNSEPNTLKFKGTTIVKDGNVQFNLNYGKGGNGLLAVGNGGTGATTRAGARKKLGFITGSKTFSFTASQLKKVQGKGCKIYYSPNGNDKAADQVKFIKEPKVFFSVKFAVDGENQSKNYDPCEQHFYVGRVGTGSFTLYFKNDTQKKTHNTYNFTIDYLAIGNTE